MYHELTREQSAVLILVFIIIFAAMGVDSLVFIGIMAWLFLPWKTFILAMHNKYHAFIKSAQQSENSNAR